MSTEPDTISSLVSEDTREIKLAKIFHNHFCNRNLVPEWRYTSHKYRVALLAGIRAVLAILEEK